MEGGEFKNPINIIMNTCSVVLIFESVDKILWCDHSNETSLAVLLHNTIFLFTQEIWDLS